MLDRTVLRAGPLFPQFRQLQQNLRHSGGHYRTDGLALLDGILHAGWRRVELPVSQGKRKRKDSRKRSSGQHDKVEYSGIAATSKMQLAFGSSHLLKLFV